MKFVSRILLVITLTVCIIVLIMLSKRTLRQNEKKSKLFFLFRYFNPESFQIDKRNVVQRQISNKSAFNWTKRPTCRKIKTNVAFLKVHKAGSTTIMNIFLRFADSNDLNIVFPNISNYLGYDRTIDLDSVLPPPINDTYNILCNHVIYDKVTFSKIMPADTVFVAIIRDPSTQVISAAKYFGLLDFLKETHNLSNQMLMSQFLQTPDIAPPEYQKFVHNRMSKDFGIPREDFILERKMYKHAERLSQEFDLVMVLEYFDESLVLLKRLLCWSLKDIIYAKLNAFSSEDKIIIDGEEKEKLYQYNRADFILYHHLKTKLLKQISSESDDFKTEVAYFKNIVAEVQNYCKSKRENQTGIMIEASYWNNRFVFNNAECDFIMTKRAIPLIEKLREKYLHKISRL